MIKKSITYKDLLGDTHTEDHYFHLKQDEVIEIELGSQKGSTFSAYLQMMVSSQDQGEILAALKEFIRKAYGHRSDDGRKFHKRKEWTDEFMESEAYTSLFMELATNEASIVEFIMGVFPAELIESSEVQAAIAKVEIPGTTLLTPADQQRLFDSLKPMPKVGPDIMGDQDTGQGVPAAFRRPPADQASSMIGPGAIQLPEALTNLTREELLAAYDRQMGKGSEDPPPPPPPAA